MTPADLLRDAFSRLPEIVHAAVDGVPDDDLAVRLDADANPIGWLVWHLARVQDDHVAAAFGSDELWEADGWRERFALPQEVAGIGYGHSRAQVSAVRATAEVLTGYYDAVHARTVQLVSTVTADDLDRVVDRQWDPPVTLGVRLVSVLQDVLEHAGQAAFVRGVLERRGSPGG
jgi:Protein of unknown function (DUF664)